MGSTRPSTLPFSIDAALSGTIKSYTPRTSLSSSISAPADSLVPPTPKSSMPKTWFFEIHEDTPDQEAANLMEHSASVLDISSDDDAETSRRKDAAERGKENIPPPEWTGAVSRTTARTATRSQAHKGIVCAKKAEKFATGPDSMLEDRSVLREIDASAFWPEGLDSTSVEVVDEKVEEAGKLVSETECSKAEERTSAAQDVVKHAVAAPCEPVEVVPLPA